MVKIRSEATGLELLPCDNPQDTIDPRAFWKAAILRRILGMLPMVDLRIPTCSASCAKSIVWPPMDMGLDRTLDFLLGGTISMSLVFVGLS